MVINMTNKQLLNKIQKIAGKIDYITFIIKKKGNYYDIYCNVFYNGSRVDIEVEYDVLDKSKIFRRLLNLKAYMREYYDVREVM